MSGTRRRRFRVREAGPGCLKVAYGEPYPGAGPGLLYLHGAYGAYRWHTRALMEALEKAEVADGMTLAQYLASEGFDLTTLRLSVRHRQPRARDGSPPPQ